MRIKPGKITMKKLPLLIIFALFLSACDEQNEDKTKSVEKDASIATEIHVTHLKDFDLFTTTSDVWIKNKLIRTIKYTDTVPTLGLTIDTTEDNDGNELHVTVPKNYTLFITAK